MAQGQANRAQGLRVSLQSYQSLTLQRFDDDTPIRLSALLELEAEDGATRTVFIGPEEGGMKLRLEGREVMVITAASPLGTQLIGRTVGDAVTIGDRAFEIVSAC